MAQCTKIKRGMGGAASRCTKTEVDHGLCKAHLAEAQRKGTLGPAEDDGGTAAAERAEAARQLELVAQQLTDNGYPARVVDGRISIEADDAQKLLLCALERADQW